MEKRTRERLEAMAAYAHQIGAEFGRGHGDWSREAIEKVALPAMWVRARWNAWSTDPVMVELFTRNFANGWQFANGAGDAYAAPTIEQPPV
jgi:hypothetical protein